MNHNIYFTHGFIDCRYSVIVTDDNNFERVRLEPPQSAWITNQEPNSVAISKERLSKVTSNKASGSSNKNARAHDFKNCMNDSAGALGFAAVINEAMDSETSRDNNAGFSQANFVFKCNLIPPSNVSLAQMSNSSS